MAAFTTRFQDAFRDLFGIATENDDLILQVCNPQFQEDYTLILFPWVKKLGISPEVLGHRLGSALKENGAIVSFNVVKGYFNFSLPDQHWLEQFAQLKGMPVSERIKPNLPKGKVLIEYCSPNTNKPLHLGHIRNILLGWSVYKITHAAGYVSQTAQVINDRGVAICKSMLAWKKWGSGKTPQSTGIKSDHFVGDYYVLFEARFKEEYDIWTQSELAQSMYLERGSSRSPEEFFSKFKNEYFNEHSILGREVRQLLLQWESGDPEVIALWSMMNQWVYDGFRQTYEKLNVRFDHTDYESETYLLGKGIVVDGLSRGIFEKDKSGAVWIDLTASGLDKKIIMRNDGTSLYITQDLGTARERHRRHQADRYIYVVGDEQDYHFKVLFETLRLLKEPYADQLHHLSYGMVDLPEGRMKSREGNVVDADDLVESVVDEARNSAAERGELAMLSDEEQERICQLIGKAALKYFILKVHPKKRMLFDPKESVDMQGHTGPYIVNAYVRIQSILRKGREMTPPEPEAIALLRPERNLIQSLMSYGEVIRTSSDDLDPSNLANYLYSLAKQFHRYYHDHSILSAESPSIIVFRIELCRCIAETLKHGMECLGIDMPDRM
ncbi:MAG: arginine--tRNA ligase [Saprospiraceae bacterium]|nr:arginine--tRNA ligase [Saprospiraceae bacterium]